MDEKWTIFIPEDGLSWPIKVPGAKFYCSWVQVAYFFMPNFYYGSSITSACIMRYTYADFCVNSLHYFNWLIVAIADMNIMCIYNYFGLRL